MFDVLPARTDERTDIIDERKLTGFLIVRMINPVRIVSSSELCSFIAGSPNGPFDEKIANSIHIYTAHPMQIITLISRVKGGRYLSYKSYACISFPIRVQSLLLHQIKAWDCLAI